MTIQLDDRIPEQTTTGVKITLYDSNSSTVIPNSMDWYLFNSLGAGVASGSLSSMSSYSLIVIGSSLMVPYSGEVGVDIERNLRVEATYTDSELGEAVENEVFSFTIVNNPGL